MLTKDQREQAEKWLLREREEALEALRHFTADADETLRERVGELSAYRSHPADLGTEAMEQEKEFLFASQEGRRLYEIDDALRRLYQSPDSFGVCERCGRTISMERLKLVPWTRLCADDQTALERAGSER